MWDFRVLRLEFVKFLLSILNWHVNSFSNSASFFIVVTHNSPVNFKLHLLLWIKGRNKNPNFKTFVCSGENLPNSSWNFQNHKSVFLQILHHSLVVKSGPLKCKFFRLSSARVKIRQIAYVNFETTNQFLFRFFIILQCHYT